MVNEYNLPSFWLIPCLSDYSNSLGAILISSMLFGVFSYEKFVWVLLGSVGLSCIMNIVVTSIWLVCFFGIPLSWWFPWNLSPTGKVRLCTSHRFSSNLPWDLKTSHMFVKLFMRSSLDSQYWFVLYGSHHFVVYIDNDLAILFLTYLFITYASSCCLETFWT